MDIAKLRRERGLTQENLAYLCGVTPRAVRNWERGTVPRRKHARLLARYLGYPREAKV